MKIRTALAAVSCLGFFALSVTAQEAAGDWIGRLDSGFKVRIHLEKKGRGYSAQVINQSGNATQLDDVNLEGGRLNFASSRLGLSYNGVWDETKNSWIGVLSLQGDHSLTLRKAGPDDLKPAVFSRPQEDAISAGPLPYDQKNVTFSSVSGVTLAGTLTMPRGKGPFPGVVLISGTGRNSRDEDVAGHKWFLVLADSLARQGYAVLRYDKRGVSGSTGDFAAATTADFAADAEMAFNYLSRQPALDASDIGLLGHSEGGIIAPFVAASNRKVAFVIMVAGPGIRGDQLFDLQKKAISRAYGAPEDYIARRSDFDRQMYALIRNTPAGQNPRPLVEKLVERGVAEKLIDAEEAKGLAAGATSAWERYFASYDPAPALGKLTVPVLALNGTKDLQVPSKENLAAIRAALKPDADAAIVEMPGLNHLLQHAGAGTPDEYYAIPETISDEALKAIGDWLALHRH
ncbi:MAG: alpha/beta hydrolase [Alphaproteobacteria bacterium]|nr:alpha/beta hydrolase [Alphaproteobacteria bacterium]